MKHLRGKKIVLAKVVWGGPTVGSMMWEAGESNERVLSRIVSFR